MNKIEIVELNTNNIQNVGGYCLRSITNSPGYNNKNQWMKDNFKKGLKYIRIYENSKSTGFIEYIPIEHSTRVIYGDNYLVIHCLWVNITGKGYATKLINICIQDAINQDKDGVIVITNPNTSWTPSKDVFLKNKFIEIDQGPYGFELLVYKLKNKPNPYFPNDWDERLKKYNDLTIIRTKQCPFIDIATENIIIGAKKLNIKFSIIDLNNRKDLLETSPTPYGVFGVIYKKNLITYNRITIHSIVKKLKELM